MEFISSSKALEVWRDTLCDCVRHDEPDLTMRQMSIILVIYLDKPPHRVRHLSESLDISKPAVTRALDKLEALGYVKRKSDEEDARSVLIQRTVKGSVFLSEVGDFIRHALHLHVSAAIANRRKKMETTSGNQ